MPYSRPTESNAAVNDGIEITPKREKIWLASAYTLTTIAGAVYYVKRNEPKEVYGQVWENKTTGELMTADNHANPSSYIPTIFLVASVAFLLYWKVRIWWRHY